MIRIAIAGGLGCALALAIAWLAQHAGGLIPCPLCLLERWPYRVGLYAAVFALLLWGIWRRLAVAVLGGAVLCAVAFAALHVGVERHWWKSPLPECSAPDFRGMTVAQRLAAMRDRPSKSCEDADYPIAALPITFAEANLLYALALAAGLAILVRSNLRSPPA